MANGFFSLRLARQSQGKTEFKHKGKVYIWQRLLHGLKNSSNVFQSAVMDAPHGLNMKVYIEDVFITDDNEDEHLEKLQCVVERITVVGLLCATNRSLFATAKLQETVELDL